MVIGERLRQLREKRKMSQGDIEQKTGLIRCYTSRVENGHTVPSIETLEKYARALDVQLYELFMEDGMPKKHRGKASISGSRTNPQLPVEFEKDWKKISVGQRRLVMMVARAFAKAA